MLPFPLKLFSAIRFITIVLFDKQRFRYVSNPILLLKWVIHIWRVQCYGCLHGSLSISMRVCKCVCRNLFFGYYINFHCGWIIIIIKLDCESNIIDGFCEQKSKQIRAFVCTQTAFRFYFHRICFFVSLFGCWLNAISLCLFQFNELQWIRAYIFYEASHTTSHKISKSKSHKISKESTNNGNEIISFVLEKKMLCLFRFRRLNILPWWKLEASIFPFSRPFSSITGMLCRGRDRIYGADETKRWKTLFYS